MKKLKSENGAITIIVLVSVLFFVAFLISSYVIVANKVQTQKEIIEETKRIYAPTMSMEEAYNRYFINDGVIPIYNAKQLLSIGTGDRFNIEGKIYVFSNNASYILEDNLEFTAEEMNLENDWIPIGNRTEEDFNVNFEGNGHTITVTNLDGTKHVYSEKNSYGGLCNLTINTIPEDAIVTFTYGEETSQEKSINVPYNTIVNYSVINADNIEKTDSIIVTEDVTLEVNIEQPQYQNNLDNLQI